MKTAIQVVVVEDRQSDYELLVEALCDAGFEPEALLVQTRTAFLDALNANIDVILTDYSLPEFSAPQVLECVREHRPEIPVIVVTGSVSEEVVVECMRDGAFDYLLKDRLTRLGPAVRGALAYCSEQREKNRVEAMIHEQAMLLDEAHDAIYVHDPENRITYWNHSAERLYGWTQSEALGKRPEDLMFSNNPQRFTEIRRRLLAFPSWVGELPQVTREGADLRVDSRWTLTRNPDGMLKSVLVVNTDITEQKRMEMQFLQAQRVQGIGTLASGVAHDLNNVLTPILMSLPMLKEDLKEGADSELLYWLETCAHRAADVVRQLLLFAKGAEGERVALQPRHLVNEMSEIARRTFPKNIEVTKQVPRDLWLVVADATQMHQVMLNLCINARDAMPQGGDLRLEGRNVELDASYAQMHPDAKPGKYVLFRIIDTGTGIPESVREKIFEPFFTTKEVGKGTGLGLSSSMGIVRSHGGFLEVESRESAGTTFSVFIPAATIQYAEEESAMTEAPSGHGETVLMVEDDAAVRELNRRILEARGYVVLSAGDGAEGVAVFAAHRSQIQIVLTDIVMPIMDGRALTHALRSIDPTVRIVATSGQTTEDQISDRDASSIAFFLPKPYTSYQLLSAIDRVLHPATPSAVKS